MQALTRAADRGVQIRIYLDGTQFAERSPQRFSVTSPRRLAQPLSRPLGHIGSWRIAEWHSLSAAATPCKRPRRAPQGQWRILRRRKPPQVQHQRLCIDAKGRRDFSAIKARRQHIDEQLGLRAGWRPTHFGYPCALRAAV
jgi:hypothetical protein